MRRAGSAKELERVRMIAANLFERDEPSGEIAGVVDAHVQTVRLWRRVWTKHGREGLTHKPHPGRPALLTDEQKGQLIELLTKGPIDNGFARHFWTTEMIRELIGRSFGVEYHDDYVGSLLHAMGVSWQKPDRRANERDEAKIHAFRDRVWPEVLKKTPKPTG